MKIYVQMLTALVFSLSSGPLQVFAETPQADHIDIPAATTTTATTTTTTPTTTSTSNTTPSTYGASQGASGSNGSAGQIAQMVGQGLLTAGTAMMPGCVASKCSCCPAAAAMIGMGILGLLQAGKNKDSSGQNAGVAGTAQGYGSSPYVDDYNTGGSLTPSADGVPTTVTKAMADVAKVGVKYDPKTGTITLPNGKTMNTGDLTNKDAMSNAGVSSGEFAKAMAMAASLEKTAADKVEKMGAHTAAMGFAEGGGGAGNNSNRSDSEASGSGGDRKPADAKASVVGMRKGYNGDMIGVAGDTIFGMMSRRYMQKSQEQGFLFPDAKPE